jgi:hypothetical protein
MRRLIPASALIVFTLLSASVRAATVSQNVAIRVTAVQTPAQVSFSPAGPVSVADSAAAGATISAVQVTTSDGQPFGGIVAIVSQSAAGMVSLSNSSLPSDVQVANINSADDGPESVTVQACENGSCVSGTLALNVTSVGTRTTITGLSLSNASFPGGAPNGTVVGQITVTTSDGSAPSLSLTGAQTGSGNDSASFQIVSGAYPTFRLETNTISGTDQPGQYNICIVASGNYANSPQQICPTIQATGPGGAGWQLAFSDEFVNPMLNWQNQQTPVSITWGTGAGFCAPGCGQVVLAAHGSQIIRAGQTVSIIGATNSGSGGSSAINTNFAVYSVTDDEHFGIYMPAPAGVFGAIGVSGASLGTGPWVTSIVNNCDRPCSNPEMVYTNNASEGWAPENVHITAAGVTITTQNTPYRDADGILHTYKSGHIQTWNGDAGFAQPLGNGYALDFYGTPRSDAGTYTGLWTSYWAVGNDNSWPGSGGGGGELDVAEFAGYSCSASLYNMNLFGGGGSPAPPFVSPNGTYVQTNHQFTTTNIGRTVTWYLDGSQIAQSAGWQPIDPIYPIFDVEYPHPSCGARATLPATALARYVRVYSRVMNGACYKSIPAPGTIPHTGSC